MVFDLLQNMADPLSNLFIFIQIPLYEDFELNTKFEWVTLVTCVTWVTLDRAGLLGLPKIELGYW